MSVAGAELFTGNNLLAMAWADGRITTLELLRNWVVVCAANFAGAAGLALLVWLSGHAELNGGAVARTALNIAAAKTTLPWPEAFFKGVLCNVLVCMAVWMAIAARSVADKVLAIVFPITAFVAAGFEHSIANMYFIPLGMLLAEDAGGYRRRLPDPGLGRDVRQPRSRDRRKPGGRQRAGGAGVPPDLPACGAVERIALGGDRGRLRRRKAQPDQPGASSGALSCGWRRAHALT